MQLSSNRGTVMLIFSAGPKYFSTGTSTSVIRVSLVRGNGCPDGNVRPVLDQRLNVLVNGLLSAGDRTIQIVTGRKAARQIGDTNTVADAIVSVQNDCEFHGEYLRLLTPSRLALNAVQRGCRDITVRVFHRDQSAH